VSTALPSMKMMPRRAALAPIAMIDAPLTRTLVPCGEAICTLRFCWMVGRIPLALICCLS
jgi:hypothetical protein